MTVKNYRRVWIDLVEERLKESYEEAIADKLKRIRFDRNGEMKPGKLALYAKKHFPNLCGLYRIQKQAHDIPKRKLRTREQPFSPKRDQMNLLKANQLNLW